jgi:tRNA pseudouridine38-40 synthase
MARYQLILAYDGTEFAGFQRQARARTVQAVVEAGLREIGWQGTAILSAGRTDTGVHAQGQVIAFDLDWKHTEMDLCQALNARLPWDAAVQNARQTSPEFHPRYDALQRTYRYRIFCQELRHPLRERQAWRVWPAAALQLLQEAAGCLTGKHDFAAFGTPPRVNGSTIRTVTSAVWQIEGEDIVFEVSANAFLYHMVRRMVYLQVQAGQGRLQPEAIQAALAGRDELPPGLAPPQGLTLWRVDYGRTVQE